MGPVVLGQGSVPVGVVVVVWDTFEGIVFVESQGCTMVEEGGKGGKLENYRQPKRQNWGI